MNYIYLISNSGAAQTRDEDMASALEHVAGYHRCTQEEYLHKMEEIRKLDALEANNENQHYHKNSQGDNI